MSDEALLSKLREAFKAESEERLGNLSAHLLEIETASEAALRLDLLEKAFREAHSLKGAARAVDLGEVESLCQVMEDVFAELKQQAHMAAVAKSGASTAETASVPPQLIPTLQTCIARLEMFLASTESPDDSRQRAHFKDLIRKLEVTRKHEVLKAGDEAGPTEAAVDPVLSESTLPPIRPPAGRIAPDPPQSAETNGSLAEAGELKTRSVGYDSLIQPKTVRLPLDRLDAVLRQAEGLFAVRLATDASLQQLKAVRTRVEDWQRENKRMEPHLRQLKNSAPQDGPTRRLLAHAVKTAGMAKELENQLADHNRHLEQDRRNVTQLVDDLQETVKGLVMLPFATLFERLPLMVRDIASTQSKQVSLILDGGEIEVDKRVLDELRDPMIHLIRNAIDHGLEAAADRIHAQKPPTGTIEVEVEQKEGSRIGIRVRDDGAGVDAEKLYRRAIEKGFISPTDDNAPEPGELRELMFKSGFSTSGIITQISGRGLGLAIAREKVEHLGGCLGVTSEVGKSTTFDIEIPSTLTTFRGVWIQEGERQFMLPGNHVRQVYTVRTTDIKTIENREVFSPTGDPDRQPLGLARLNQILGLPEPAGTNSRPTLAVAVIEAGDLCLALGFEAVLGVKEILVKDLGPQLKRVPFVAGATVMGTGAVVPVLNVQDLLKRPMVEGAASKPSRPATAPKADNKSILVAEDSITSRMLLKSILESSGYRVETAVDGLEAFNMLQAGGYDLVVSDIEMPHVDGFELTSRIRGHKALGETPVVLVTSLDAVADRKRGIDAGADAYIVKSSFDQSDLVEVIRRLL